MSKPASSTSNSSAPANLNEVTRGHIGLIVLASIVGGLVLGLLLVLVVFAGAREPVITGAALISLACGMLMLFALRARSIEEIYRRRYGKFHGVLSAVAGSFEAGHDAVAAEEVRLSGLAGQCQRLVVHPGEHEHAAALCVLDDGERSSDGIAERDAKRS